MSVNRYTLGCDSHDNQIAEVFSTTVTRSKRVKEHRHDFHEVLWVTSGKLIHTINGHRQELCVGDLVMIEPDDLHSLDAIDNIGGIINNTAFPSRLLEDYPSLHTGAAWFNRNNGYLPTSFPDIISMSPAQESMLRQLHQHAIRSSGNDISVLAMLNCLKSVAHQSLQNPLSHDPAPSWLKQLRAEMTHPKNVITGRDALSNLCDRNISYIHRMWKKHFHQTPGQFINSERIGLAKIDLIQSDKDMTTICYNVGFNDLSYFYRLFKDECGCSPLQYRKQNSYLSNE